MAKVQITMDDACDACWQRDKTPRASIMDLTLNGKTWYLCEEHETKLAGQLTEVLGEPGEDENK